MKANEIEDGKVLMIGDLVVGCIETDIVGEATYKIPCKVTDINHYGDVICEALKPFPDELDWQDGDNFSWIEPMPLTAEILEKNGFYFGYTTNEMDLASNTIATLSEDWKGWVWDEGDGAIKVIFPNEADGGMITIDGQSFDRHLTMVFCKNIFVHELQHALHLCGIEKEIEL